MNQKTKIIKAFDQMLKEKPQKPNTTITHNDMLILQDFAKNNMKKQLNFSSTKNGQWIIL